MDRTRLFFILLFLSSFLFPNCEKLENFAKGQKRLEYVRSREMQLLIPTSVILPEEYYKSPDVENKRYPVIILLHGFGGDHAQWPRIADLKKIANNTQVIFVCPDAGYDSWYFDSLFESSKLYYERHIIQEVITHIDTSYRTLGAQGRAITGLSMGGHGALRFISLYPDSFVAAGSMSGILDLRVFPLSWNIAKRLGPFKDFPHRWKTHSSINLLSRLKGQKKGIIIACGTDDFALAVNRAYRDSAAVHEVEISYTEATGGHTQKFWKDHLSNQVQFLKKYLLPSAE
ncbi:MAG: esterase family protein [Calditrichaeota bacterium]|nr:MAG: esterase family protein [Calditrichota bacterium]